MEVDLRLLFRAAGRKVSFVPPKSKTKFVMRTKVKGCTIVSKEMALNTCFCNENMRRAGLASSFMNKIDCYLLKYIFIFLFSDDTLVVFFLICIHLKPAFHFNRIVAKRSVFHCFVNTQAQLIIWTQ